MDEPPSKRHCVLRSEGKIQESVTTTDIQDHYLTSWIPVKGNQRPIKPFSENTDLPNHLKNMVYKSPADFYELMVPEEVFQEIADCTNKFADEQHLKTKNALPSTSIKIDQWISTNNLEMKQFFGLIMFMGLVKLPRISDYWSGDTILYHPFPGTIMSHDRFEILLQMLHFSNDNKTDKLDQTHFTGTLLDTLNVNFKKHYNPAEDLLIKKSPLLFRGQKNNQIKRKNKTILLKLCAAPGYVYKVGLCIRNNLEALNVTLFNSLMTLCSDSMNKGHTLYTGNCFTSMNLARKLLNNETHLVGFTKSNRKQLPLEVTAAKLEPGSFIARESYDGITVMKFKKRIEVFLVLSTKHSTQFVTKCSTNGKINIKPQIIVDYEKAKEAVDVCDKIADSSSTGALDENLKWYKRLAIDLLLDTAVINAFTLYKSVTKKNIQIEDFRKQLLVYLCQKKEITVTDQRQNTNKHKLAKKVGSVRQNRRTCNQCYKDNTEVMGRVLAKNKSPKVATYCETCPKQPHLCLSCFNKTHC